MRLIKRINGYSVRWQTPRGIRTMKVPGSSKDTTLAQARQLMKTAAIIENSNAQEKLTHVAIAQIVGGKDTTVAGAIERWKEELATGGTGQFTQRDCIQIVTTWARRCHLLNRHPAAVLPKDVNEYINQDGPVKLGTRYNRVKKIRLFFDFCLNAGYVQRNVARMVRRSIKMDKLTHAQKETTPPSPMTEETIAKLLAVVDGRRKACDLQLANSAINARSRAKWIKLHAIASFWYCGIRLSRHTGLRLGDVMALEWGSFSTPGKLTVWTQKKDKRVSLDLTPEIEAIVADIPQLDERFCFPYHAKWSLNHVGRITASKQFVRIFRKAGVDGHTFHDLRATYILRCREAGIPMPLISAAVAHSSEAQTLSYLRGVRPAAPPVTTEQALLALKRSGMDESQIMEALKAA